MFLRLELHRWRQFARINVKFHRRLTVLTGANGAGKTTILNLLSRHFGWSIPTVSTPSRAKSPEIGYQSGLWRIRREADPTNQHEVGTLTYLDGHTAQVVVPNKVTEEYQVTVQGAQHVPGLYVSSHRPVSFYRRIDSIPTKIDAKEEILRKYIAEQQSRYTAHSRNFPPSYRIKEALVSLATFGYGNRAVASDYSAVSMFEGFQEVLRIVLPSSLGFRRIVIRLPEVVFETASGDFAFDAMSGGVASIVEVAWQLFLYSQLGSTFVAIIDEPENHLHPKLQQSLLPSFLRAFPEAQFIVATHNPFIVTSVAESNVYVLDYSPANRVHSRLLDLVNKAGSANEVLRDVLGVHATMPIWAQQQLEDIVLRRSKSPITDSSIDEIIADLARVGLADMFPTAMAQIARQEHDKTE